MYRQVHTETASRQVSWWEVHLFCQQFIAALFPLPIAGTPVWCDLDDDDPRKLASVIAAGELHVLHREISQESLAESSRDIAASFDWRKAATELQTLAAYRAENPWSAREAS